MRDNVCGFQRSKSMFYILQILGKQEGGGGGGLANKLRQCISCFYTSRKTVIKLEGSFFYSVW